MVEEIVQEVEGVNDKNEDENMEMEDHMSMVKHTYKAGFHFIMQKEACTFCISTYADTVNSHNIS